MMTEEALTLDDPAVEVGAKGDELSQERVILCPQQGTLNAGRMQKSR